MKLTAFLRRCHLPALMLLTALPPAVLVLCQFASGAALPLACLAALYLPVLMLCILVPGRFRLPVLGLCAALMLAFILLCAAHRAVLCAFILCASGVLLAALPFAERSPSLLSPLFFVAAIFAQLISQFLVRYAEETVHAALYMPVNAAFLGWLLLLLLACNRISMDSASLARYRLPAGMARTGMVLTTCIFALTLALCTVPAVVSGVIRFFHLLRTASAKALLFLLQLFPAEETGGLSGAPQAMPFGDAAAMKYSTSFLARLLEKLAAVMALVMLIIGSVILLRMLARLLVHLARRIIAHLKRYTAAVSEDYEDEITDTRSEDSERSFRLLGKKPRASMIYPDTPAGRIRRRYAQLRRRHPAWTDSSTARENLSAETAALYERARYSDHALSSEDAQRFEREA